MKTAFIPIIPILLSPLAATAESVEEFLRKSLKNNISAENIHPSAKYIVRMGESEFSLNKDQVLAYINEIKGAGTKSEIIDFKILGTAEENDIISVVSRTKMQQTIGSSVITGEAVSHSILQRKNGTFAIIFNHSTQ